MPVRSPSSHSASWAFGPWNRASRRLPSPHSMFFSNGLPFVCHPAGHGVYGLSHRQRGHAHDGPDHSPPYTGLGRHSRHRPWEDQCRRQKIGERSGCGRRAVVVDLPSEARHASHRGRGLSAGHTVRLGRQVAKTHVTGGLWLVPEIIIGGRMRIIMLNHTICNQ